MKKTLLRTVLTLMIVLAMALTLIACAGEDGADGVNGTNGKSAYELAVENGYTGTLDEWLASLKGETGASGNNGRGIISIDKTESNGLVDTYKITYTDNSTSTFTVTNGKDGVSIEAAPGGSSYTPTVSIKDGNWYIDGVDSGISALGEKGENGLSAFEIYKKYHPEYTGTEAEWIEGLKGASGDPGVAGAYVTDAYVDGEYHLWIVLSNGGKIDAGYVGVEAPASQYIVIFVDYDYETLKIEEVGRGKAATAPENPKRIGYIFNGWDKELSAITSNTVVTAQYEKCTEHEDEDNNGTCDACEISVVVILDLFVLNDLHGKFDDGEACVGVDELSTYLENAYAENSGTVLLASGDMWQGSAESNLTKGAIITEWMNAMGFESMTLGNHEFDWGSEYIDSNGDLANFSILAINVYDIETGERADFCDASVIVERDGIKIGIIGAIGDCKSSISASRVANFDFKVGDELTALVKAESERLRALGCEMIVYSLHDGFGYSTGEDPLFLSAEDMRDYYDVELSNGYVDIVFEGHSHASYVHVDEYGVYHLQNGGYDNGISHVEIKLNRANDKIAVQVAEIVEYYDEYNHLSDHPIVDELIGKYYEDIAIAYNAVGYNSEYRDSNFIRQLVADLYRINGLEKWGEEYDIVLGGGYISARDPQCFSKGVLYYSNLMDVLPFDNEIYLCSISGADLKSRFIYNTNYNYFISLTDYGISIMESIDDGATYYIIADSYSVDYADNNLTAIECLGSGVYARDLVAAYALEEGLITSANPEITIAEAIELASSMDHNEFTQTEFIIEGTIVEIPNTQYGNLYLMDEYGNIIYLYGVKDGYGNWYGDMEDAPQVGEKIRILTVVGFYGSAPELKGAVLLAIVTED